MVTGILSQSTNGGALNTNYEIYPRYPEDIVRLSSRNPNYLAVIYVVCSILVIVSGWVLLLRRQVAKQTETLRASENRFRSIFEEAGDVILVLGDDLRILDSNPAASRLFDLSPDRLALTTLRDLLTLDPLRDLSEGSNGGGREKDVEFETSYGAKNGEQIHLMGKMNTFDFGGVLRRMLVLRDITQRKEAEVTLQRMLDQEEILMKELQHRVKNNLNVILSLLSLESARLTDDNSKRVFKAAQSRIHSMSAIYEQLYRSTDLGSVELREYIRNLAESIFASYALNTEAITLHTDLAKTKLDLRRAVPLGLIVNELITNALKYAYPSGDKGEIRVGLENDGTRVVLTVSDAGVGFPKEFAIEKTDTLGLKLVEMLADQIDGTVSIDCSAGTSVRVSIEL
jgi:PAS domain S-box-containing protein